MQNRKYISFHSFCLASGLCLLLTTFAAPEASAQQTLTFYGQTFKIDTLYPATGTKGMNSPWEVVYGPDDSLWVTEAHNYHVWKIHPGNKGSRLVLDLSGQKDFTDNANKPWPQGGLMGLAIHPQFSSGKPWVYIAYVYHQTSCGTASNGQKYCSYNTKISRYQYSFSNGSLTWMDDVVTGLDGSSDHNSGRLRIDPLVESDGKYHLYYTIGDLGAGNLGNIDRPNHAQDTTIVQGKTLRLNTEPDPSQTGAQQWIPGDNPFPANAPASARSPIYSYGHRNPQGLAFGSVNGGVSYILYSCEHGDKSDDEVNIITGHTNYGWPKVAGYCDDNYTSSLNDSMYLANKSVVSESGFCDTSAVQEPIFSFYPWSRSQNVVAGAQGNMYWPTIAPTSIAFYGSGDIPGWQNSLLISSLKNGLWRLRLNADGMSVYNSKLPNSTDTLHYLNGYRLRNVTVSPHGGDTLFIAVDSSCCSLNAAGTFGSSATPRAMGYILRMAYISVLALPDSIRGIPPQQPAVTTCNVYPNPTNDLLFVKGPQGQHMPMIAMLYDVTGKSVLTKAANSNDFTIDLRGLVPGMYFLRIWNGFQVPIYTDKIILH